MRENSSESGKLTAWVIVSVIAFASVLLALGLAAFFLHGAATRPLQPRGFPGVVAHAVHGIGRFEARGLIEAGLVVLLLAPFSRLVAGVIRNARGGDWRFVAIGLLVIALLLGGIALGTG